MQAAGKGIEIKCPELQDCLSKKMQGNHSGKIELDSAESQSFSALELSSSSFISVTVSDSIVKDTICYYKPVCPRGIQQKAGLKDIEAEVISSDEYSRADIVLYLNNPEDDMEPNDLFAQYMPSMSMGLNLISMEISELAQRVSAPFVGNHLTMAFMTWSKERTSKNGSQFLICKVFDSRSSMCLFLWDTAFTQFRSTQLPCVIAIQSQFLRLVPTSPFKRYHVKAYSLSNSAHIRLVPETEGKTLPSNFFLSHLQLIKGSLAQLSSNRSTTMNPMDHTQPVPSRSSATILHLPVLSASAPSAGESELDGSCENSYDGGDESDHSNYSEDLSNPSVKTYQESDAYSDEVALLRLQKDVFGKPRPHVLSGHDWPGHGACVKSVWLMFANMAATFSPDGKDMECQRTDRRTPIMVTFFDVGNQNGISVCDFCHEASLLAQANMQGTAGINQVQKPSDCVHIRTIRLYFQRAYRNVPGMECLPTDATQEYTSGLDCLIARNTQKFRKGNSDEYVWKPDAVTSDATIFQFGLERHLSSRDRYCLLQYGFPGTDVFGLVLTGRHPGNISYCHCITCDSSGCHHAQHVRSVGGFKRSNTRPQSHEFQKILKRHVAKDGKGLILYGHSRATIPNQNPCVHEFELESMLDKKKLKTKLTAVSQSTDVSDCLFSTDVSDEESCSSCFEADYSSSSSIDSAIAKHDCGLARSPVADQKVPTADQSMKGAKGKRGRNDGNDEHGGCFGRRGGLARTSANLKFQASYHHTSADKEVDWVMYDRDAHELLYEERHNSQECTGQTSHTSPDDLNPGQTFDEIRGHANAKIQDAQGDYDPEFLRSTSRWYYLQDGQTIRTLGSAVPAVPAAAALQTPTSKSEASAHALECLSNLKIAVDQIPSDQRTSESYKALSLAMEGMNLNLHNIPEPSTPSKRYMVFHVGCVYEMPVHGPIENYDGAEDNLIHAAGHMFFTYEFIRVFITQLLVSSTTFHAYIRTALQHYVQSMKGVANSPALHQDLLLYNKLRGDLAKIERRQGDPRVLVNFRDSVLDAITLQVSKMESYTHQNLLLCTSCIIWVLTSLLGQKIDYAKGFQCACGKVRGQHAGPTRIIYDNACMIFDFATCLTSTITMY